MKPRLAGKLIASLTRLRDQLRRENKAFGRGPKIRIKPRGF